MSSQGQRHGGGGGGATPGFCIEHLQFHPYDSGEGRPPPPFVRWYNDTSLAGSFDRVG